MRKETGISGLNGKFINGNVIDMDFKESKGFIAQMRKPMTAKRMQELRKVKLP
jgi:hypothetical protein